MVEKIVLLGLGMYIPFVDVIDFLVRFWHRAKIRKNGRSICPTSVADVPHPEKIQAGAPKLRPYKILVSVHSIAGTFEDFKNNIKPFGYSNVLVVDDASTDNTAELLKQEGIPFITNKINLNKPASIRKAFQSLPEEIETVIVIDPDATVLNLNPKEYGKQVSDFEEVLSEFQASGYDACAVRIVVRCGSILESFQNLEYKISMGLTRKSMGGFCAVSGAFAIFKRNTLGKVLAEHSTSIYGEDYETSLRILEMGGRIYYDGRLCVMTNQRKTLWDLTRQRMGWDLSVIKIHSLLSKKLLHLSKNIMAFYQYIFYNTIVLILLHPIRILSCLLIGASLINLVDNVSGLNVLPDHSYNRPVYFTSFYLFYLIIVYCFLFAAERRRRDRYIFLMPVFPFYILYMSLVARTLGFLNFFAMILFKKKLINDGYW